MKTIILPLRNSVNLSPARLAFLLILFVLPCFALLPHVRATCQEGCLTNENTVFGDDALISLTTGFGNTAMGFNALFSNTTGNQNTANGYQALSGNTTGSENTANGYKALLSNTTGLENTAIGVGALEFNTGGSENTATGWAALALNTTGSGNTATGWDALGSNNGTGNNNTATGAAALLFNTTGSNNTATGASALFNNTTGLNNTATGVLALTSNTTGSSNTAHGYQALANSGGSSNNTGIGFQALFGNGFGHDNTANGFQALFSNTNGHDNTATGHNALQNNTSGNFNVALGANAGFNLTNGSNNIDIFNRGVAGESNTIRIGKVGTHTATFIAGISGATVPSGVPVIIDTDGHLGTSTSSARFKDAIKPMDKASEAILALKPVTFRYKEEFDPDGIPQFGLLAEDVEKVSPALVARDADGKPYTVRYEAVNAMLLNEFLKEHKAFLEEQRRVQKQGATIARLEHQIDVLTAGLQKVSAQLELSKSGPQTVLNDQ